MTDEQFKLLDLRSLVPEERCLRNLHRLARHVVDEGVPGDVVECGVFKGGSASVLADAVRDEERAVWLFDTFDGIPPATAKDGPAAQPFSGSMVGSVEATIELFDELNLPPAIVRKGAFAETFKGLLPEQVAFLHVDADWYESVLLCLRTFYDRVSDGGVIVLDDFSYWEGARLAFYEFCRERDIAPLLERCGLCQAFWIKGLESNREAFAQRRWASWEC